jgi:hypothetical protein
MNLIIFPIPILFGQIDHRITKDIQTSIGSLKDVTIMNLDDKKEWSIEIDNPEIIAKYKPPFYNRGAEYAQQHSYFEALCHASSGDLQYKIISSSTARYAKRYEQSCETNLCPVTIHIAAFVEQIHKKNKQFLDELRNNLKNENVPYVDDLVYGIFRNIAIQYHFNKPSLPAKKTLHIDHINSCIHMAITLNGTRNILFVDEDIEKKIKLKQNDVYLTSPAILMHGIEVPKLTEKDASISIQFRTLLSANIASELYKNHTIKICFTICHLLRKYDKQFLLPTYEEYINEVQDMINNAPIILDDTPKKITYINKNILL